MKIAILVVFLFVGAFGKLEFMSEVSRHGARAPRGIYNYTVDPNENFKVSMELSNVGMRQHYLIGTQVRKTYIEKHKLISEKYEFSEITFNSTDRTRTLESGMSQISGIFPPSECLQHLNNWQQKNAVPPTPIEDIEKIQEELKDKALPDCFNLLPVASELNDYSYDIQCQDSNCQAYQTASKEVCDSDKQQKMYEPYLEWLTPKFNELIGPTESSQVGSICSYLILADVHSFELIFDWWNEKETIQDKLDSEPTIKEQVLYNCNKLDDAGLYCKAYGDERLYKIGAKYYLDKLIDSMDKIIAGNQTQKIELNFSHDTSLAIILSGLGYVPPANPPLASTLFIELHSEGKEYFVKTLYNGKALKFGLCQQTECDYDTFKENVKQRTYPGTIEDVCNGKFTI